MSTRTFTSPGPIALFVELGRGSLRVVAVEDPGDGPVDTVVDVQGRDADDVTIEQSGRGVSVVAPRRSGVFSGDSRLDVTITLPAGSDLELRSGSADIEVEGRAAVVKAKSGSGRVGLDRADGPVAVVTGSGEVRIDTAGADLRLKSGSGDLEVGSVAGSLLVSTGSGDVRIGRAEGPGVVKSGSGDLQVAESRSDLTWTTGSGDLVVGAAHRGRLSVKGASGDVRVGVPVGVPVWTDISTVSGAIRSQLPSAGEPREGQDHVELRARTVSGDVLLLPA